MSHVDEGTLHAYLDGAVDALVEAGALPRGTTRASIDAHLATCTDCRALLEAERVVRARAGSILADVGAQSVDVPPFATLQHQSAARPRRRAWPLAWAASLFLALGAGWWGSELFRAERYADVSESAAPAREPEKGAPAASAMPEAETMLPRESAPARTAGDAATLQDVGAAVAQRSEERGSANTAPQRAAAADAAPPVQAEASLRKAENRVAAAGDSAAARTAGQNAVSGAVIDRTAPLTRQLVPGPPAAPPPAAPGRLGFISGGIDTLTATRIAAGRRQLAQFNLNLVPFVPATAADFGDMPLLHIRDAGPPRIERGSSIGYVIARVTQRTAAGVDIEIVQLREVRIALEQLVVTGVAAQREQSQQRAEPPRVQQSQAMDQAAVAKQTAAAVPVQVADSVLSDGRREVVLRLPASDVLVAVRAALPSDELRHLVTRLVPIARN